MKIQNVDIHDIINIRQDEEFIFGKGIHLKREEYKYTFIAKEQEETLGYIYAEEMKYIKTIIIFGLEVKEENRKQGIATKLIERLEKECKDNGIESEIVLYSENSTVEKFYKMKGFEIEYKLKSAYKFIN